ncbi:MAG: hypothetical protein L3J39_18775 [Verrucomicrobiales bacterium]|nr:hypothetical protein [Verrucomicrobiales bacterium]
MRKIKNTMAWCETRIWAWILALFLLAATPNLHASDPGFELPIVVAAGDTTGYAKKEVTVNLRPGTASSAKYIRLRVHNLQRIPQSGVGQTGEVPMAYLQIKNGAGVLSSWIALSNNNSAVKLTAQAKAYGGIGGGHHSLLLGIDLANLKKTVGSGGGAMSLTDNNNTFIFRINPQAYKEGASAYRVTFMSVTAGGNSWPSLLAGTASSYYPGNANDSGDYIAGNSSTSASLMAWIISQGKLLWESETLKARPGLANTLGKGDIRAKCMDCHTSTGYDLKYFGYSNESIYKRSRFHGLSDTEAKRVTRYIRNLKDKNGVIIPSYGRPWNPPYQPGSVNVGGTDTPLSQLAVERWAAGAGEGGVLDSDKEMMLPVFDDNGDGKVWQWEVDKVFRLSQINGSAAHLGLSLIDIPIHLQLPDWNRWLPRVHPVDIWPDFKDGNLEEQQHNGKDGADPYKAYLSLVNFDGTPRRWQLGALLNQGRRFSNEGATQGYGTSWEGKVVTYGNPTNPYRSAGKFNTKRLNAANLKNYSSAAYSNDMHDEYAKRALTHWIGVKYFEIYHVGELENKTLLVAKNANPYPDSSEIAGEWGWLNRGSTVFDNAPHKTARNTRYWEGRTLQYDPENPLQLDADDQSQVAGYYASVVWYHLEVILNSGHKLDGTSVSNPVDWAYNYSLIESLRTESKQAQAMLHIVTLMKNWQVRDIRRSSTTGGTIGGWGLRTCTPYIAYSFDSGISDLVADLDGYSPDLYRYFLNTALMTWMRVVKHPEFPYTFTGSAFDKHWPRQGEPNTIGQSRFSLLSEPGYKPSDWNGSWQLFDSTNSADTFWRLLPLLDQVGVDRVYLEDFKNWCKTAWPGASGGLNDWDSRLDDSGANTLSIHVKPDKVFRIQNLQHTRFHLRFTGSDPGPDDLVASPIANWQTRWRPEQAQGQWMYINAEHRKVRLHAQPNGSNSVGLAPDTETWPSVKWRVLSLGNWKVRLQSKLGKRKYITMSEQPETSYSGKIKYIDRVKRDRSIWKLIDSD